MSDVIERSSGDASPFVAVTRIIVGSGTRFPCRWQMAPSAGTRGRGAGFTVGSAGLPLGVTMVTVLVFTLIGCLSVMAPVVAFLVASERMRGPLESARTLLVRHNAVIMSVVLLIIAAALIGGGISDLWPTPV